MALALPDTTDTSAHESAARLSGVGAGVALAAVGTVGWLGWLSWRVATLALHPIPVAAVVIELLGFAVGLAVVVALAGVRTPGDVRDLDREDSNRYAFAVADLVGRRRKSDLRGDVRSLARLARDPHRPTPAGLAVAGVLIDGPRRLAFVVVAIVGLLIGVSPVPAPSVAALMSLAVGVVGLSFAGVRLSGGRIALGDRLRWSYGSLGEIVVRDDLDGVAPRRWVGTVGAIVVINLAVALRGMSDRWTHGLPAMDDEARVVAMVLAMSLALGALYTLLTTAAPQLDNAHLVSRRLEERTARQSVLGGAICVGLIGLVAGVLPGCVDPADDDAARIEQVTEGEVGTAVDD
jgi:hypothetical protein